MPWLTLERLLLEAGLFPSAVQPVSEAELADQLDMALARVLAGEVPRCDDAELDLLRWWRDRFRRGGWAPTWIGCACRVDPPRVRATGRVLAGWQEVGDPAPDEAGRDAAAGTHAAAEVNVDAVVGRRWWAGIGGRGAGRLAGGGALAPDDLLAWPGWSPATAPGQAGRARQRGGAWTLDLPRAVAGVRLGRWAVSAGWEPRRVGPGLGGGLTLDRGGVPFAALTARRTLPFSWQGVMGPLAPAELLLRVGRLSPREVLFFPDRGTVSAVRAPWFMSWRTAWRPTAWSRLSATHAVMAASLDGTLWPDLLQLNFPVIGTTRKEKASGPVTDRIFALGLEARWRDAPWPLLPAAAGRVWWEYGGTDFLPSGPAGLWPEIAAPASVLGLALVDPRWDLAVEYAELVHDKVLWYTNAGFPEGYTQDGTLLAHPLGGGGEAVSGTVRVRPGARARQWELTASRARFGVAGLTPGLGERWSLQGGVRRQPRPGERAPLLWAVQAELRREEARPTAGAAVRRTWGRVWLEVGLP